MPNLSLDDNLELDIPSSTPKPTTPAKLTWATATVVEVGDGLNRFKPTGTEMIRFALIPTAAPVQAQTHFVQIAGTKQRSFICGGPKCRLCAQGDKSSFSAVALAVRYVNAYKADGKLPVEGPLEYEIGYIQLSGTGWNMILRAPEEDSGPTDIDYVAFMDGKKYQFVAKSKSPKYRAAGDEGKVLALAEPFLDKLEGKLGNPIPANATIQTTTEEESF